MTEDEPFQWCGVLLEKEVPTGVPGYKTVNVYIPCWREENHSGPHANIDFSWGALLRG